MNKDSFLDKVVFGWIKSDFERMLKIQKVPHGDGNINFALALYALAIIDALGTYLLGEDPGPGNFSKSVDEYISRCFRNPDDYKEIDVLKDFFRHSLAHEYFARGAVSRDNKTPALYVNNQTGLPTLDAETLVNDLLDSFNKFRNELSKETYDSRTNEAKERIKELMQKHEASIGRLPQSPTSTSLYDSCSNLTDGDDFTTRAPRVHFDNLE